MGPKKGRRAVKRIEVPTETPSEFELGDTLADIQRRKEEKEAQIQREGEARGKKHTQQRQFKKSVQGQTEVTQKQRLEQKGAHHSHHTHNTRTGTGQFQG